MDGNPIEKEASATFREEWGEKLLFRHCWVTKNLHTTTIITPLCAADPPPVQVSTSLNKVGNFQVQIALLLT